MPEANPHPTDIALPSVRGLILGRNCRGETVDRTTLRQWLRLGAEKHHIQKADLWEPVATEALVRPLLEEATHLGIRLSLRTTSATDTALLRTLQDAGLFDVLLCLNTWERAPVDAWFGACEALGLPLRVQLHATVLANGLPDGLMAALSRAAVVSVGLRDPFTESRTTPSPPYSPAILTGLVELAEALHGPGPELHLMDIPFCAVPEGLWGSISNRPQQITHHQHYRPEAHDFARRVAGLSPRRIHQAVEVTLGQGASFHNLIDRAVLPWILEKPRWFFWLWFLHKLTRRLPLRQGKTASVPEGLTACEQALVAYQREQQCSLSPVCAVCRLHPICDHHTEVFKQAFPQVSVRAVPGDACVDPLAFRAGAPAWYDTIDEERRSLPAHLQALAQKALRIIGECPPTREIAAERYAIEDHATHHMPASVRWFSFSTAELQSTVLARLAPPFTLSVTVGGGIAERVGFAFGRHARILCPMTAYAHKITLHVDAQGHYVLLRDGVAVRPAVLAHRDAIPERLGTILEPRIALTNIDGQIVTQTVLLWEENAVQRPSDVPARHSIVIVCTRFARRLQAVLQALVHQQGLPPDALEIIVGFVPGIDATDDVLDDIVAIYPELRLVRVPFATDRDRAKGFMINECVALASGTWITLLDADILLPPDYFSRLGELQETVCFAAPEGRYMLNSATTSRILLGDVRSWADYAALQQSGAEFRHRESDGVPPGFCQSFRRTVFDRVRYEELDHFEGSDWWFSKRVIDQFGPETRLEGMGVLHLDHGGSQWYGTGKQR